ncbi:MAG TPA: hypothetical protein PKC18_16435, partial [Lacipirellulaceae bacterium]|nr:hypothetical protein [Lacipirellulaceae bacterium]
MKRLVALVLVAALAAPASGQITLNGSRDLAYGAPLAVQTVETNFGDGNPAGGSELNAAYALVTGGTLHLLLTGNLESNFNKLNIFFDSVPGGQNVLQNDANNGGNNPTNDRSGGGGGGGGG